MCTHAHTQIWPAAGPLHHHHRPPTASARTPWNRNECRQHKLARWGGRRELARASALGRRAGLHARQAARTRRQSLAVRPRTRPAAARARLARRASTPAASTTARPRRRRIAREDVREDQPRWVSPIAAQPVGRPARQARCALHSALPRCPAPRRARTLATEPSWRTACRRPMTLRSASETRPRALSV